MRDRVVNMTCSEVFFSKILGVWIANKKLCDKVFDISAHLKQKLRRKQKKSSKTMLIKTEYPTLLHCCDSFVLT